MDMNVFKRSDEDFSISYSLLQNSPDKGHNCYLFFRTSYLYKYICGVYQGVDPDLNIYKSRTRLRIRKILRLVSVALMWLCLIIKLFEFLYTKSARFKTQNTFKNIVHGMTSLVWMFRYVVLHNFGVLVCPRIFNTPQEIIDELARDATSEEDKENLKAKLREKSHKIYRIIGTGMLCVTLLPIIKWLVPIVIQESNKSGSSETTFIRAFLELFVLFYTRIVSLPFLFYMIYVSFLQCVQLETFSEKLTKTSKSADILFQEYRYIHEKIAETASKIHIYLCVVITVTIVWGALALYTFVQRFSHYSKVPNQTIGELFDIFSIFLSSAVEVTYLFLLPWLLLGSVAGVQETVIGHVVAIPYSQMEYTSPFSTFAGIFEFANRLEKYQKYTGTGYKVFGFEIKKLKTVWFFILAPIGLLIANAAIKGKM